MAHNSKTDPTEPSWGSVDKTALPRAAFADQGEVGKKSTWGYPHHHIKGGTKKNDDGIWIDGEMFLNREGLNAAWSAANGARSGQKASQSVLDHLQAHRLALGVDKSGSSAVVEDAIKRHRAFGQMRRLAS